MLNPFRRNPRILVRAGPTIEVAAETMNDISHYPVMYRQLLDSLELKEKKVIVDCTVGLGSHALKFFEVMSKDAQLIGIDKDEDALGIAARRLEAYRERLTLVKGDFSNLDNILANLSIKEADIFLFDLGVSMYQLSEAERGFSFLREGPLDMRMDRNSFLCAYDLVNNLSELELENIFRRFGEERYARRIARRISLERKNEPIASTVQLGRIIMRAVPAKISFKIHPATRVFQALRVAVNRELEVLPLGLSKALDKLRQYGKIAVISFHSLEDRICKHIFKEYAVKGILEIITKKPLVPSPAEIEENHASRSAKLKKI
jgi:16S rRNA (cytosine1402-N4)-methyltransferase